MARICDSGYDEEEGAWFEGFTWPVPRAFAAALAAPRFEQGDVLYCAASGYAPLEDPIPSGLQAIQVLSPPRSTRPGQARSGEEDRRRLAWNAELVVERVEVGEGRSRIQASTQGRLFTALWRGDARWLDPDSEPPPLPRLARELHAALETARAAFTARGLPGPRERGCRFLFVRDLSSDASLLKARAIERALGALGRVDVMSLTPTEAGVEAGDAYHPALQVRGCFVAGRSEGRVRQGLRTALYAGASDPLVGDRNQDEKSVSDRFSLARHGLLETI